MSTPESTPAKQVAVLYGGEEMSCLRNDDKIETVKVRILPMRHRLKYIELCIDGDGQGIIELCCDWPANHADKFTAEAQDAILEKAKALNLTLAERYLVSLNNDSKKLAPLYEKVTKRMIDQAGPLLRQFLASSMLVPTQPSPSVSPENKSSTKVPTGSDSSSPVNPPPSPSAP